MPILGYFRTQSKNTSGHRVTIFYNSEYKRRGILFPEQTFFDPTTNKILVMLRK